MTRLHTLRQDIYSHYYKDETEVVETLLSTYKDPDTKTKADIEDKAKTLVEKARDMMDDAQLVDKMLYQYKLSSREGLALMCMAEALLRIPDSATASELVADRLTDADWTAGSNDPPPSLASLSHYALELASNLLNDKTNETSGTLSTLLRTLVKKSSAPLILESVRQSMALLSHKFVIGETIEKALENALKDEEKGYLHSYDMLGEAALTTEDAEIYLHSYQKAINQVGKASNKRDVRNGPGISVKLSALHPRYEESQRDRVMTELLESLKVLTLQAKSHNIGVTIDAEESYRLDLSLDLLEQLLSIEEIAQWGGVGFVVQAYQKRALPVIQWLKELSKTYNVRIPIRLVKGAYWDSEIKLAQEQGVEDFPVFTQKSSTDLCYLVCAQKLLEYDLFYPMFATHNAQTIAEIYHLAKGRDYEFQKLYGMGNELYKPVVEEANEQVKCRIYAPVGTHKDLLPYLVRRLLENGANTSFVNHITDKSIPVETLTESPFSRVQKTDTRRHPQIPLPCDLYGKDRLNSQGHNLDDRIQRDPLLKSIQKEYDWKETLQGLKGGDPTDSHNPFTGESICEIGFATPEHVDKAFETAQEAAFGWNQTPVETRANMLEKAASLLEENTAELMALCSQEAGKTLPDGLAEVREAVDFCRYYAQQARHLMEKPMALPGPSGEDNTLHLHGRGPFVCISPWNFPLAIFLGQVSAALVTGNPVLAKPSGKTPLIAQYAVKLLHQAGIPEDVLHFLPGRGASLGQRMIDHPGIAGVTLTGSTYTAWHINKSLATKRGPIVPFIAETGGQNAMIVDSSALPEQVVMDVITSAFRSAGQRCSALRVLFLQDDIAERVISLLIGAMEELVIGDPGNYKTDVGPVIDTQAQKELEAHKTALKNQGHLLYECTLPQDCHRGSFVTPAVYEIPKLFLLEKENFGPLLHVIRYQRDRIDEVFRSIRETGFGLTQGLHTRIQSKIQAYAKQLQVGNMYVNRNMIGAIVGSQPFGGEGLSGTGPKAGGPHYLYRFLTERTLSINTTAQGGNTQLLSLREL